MHQKKKNMIEIGKTNTMTVVKTTDFGIYLDGEELGEILMPIRYVPENIQVGDSLKCFLYLDSEDRLITTTEIPYVEVGGFATLECVSESKVGAFVDWGLSKDLLVPFREQNGKMKQGNYYVCGVFLDDASQRLVATARIEAMLNTTPPEYEEGEEVELLIYRETELGFMAIVNNSHTGLLYKNEVFKQVRQGQRCVGYIKSVREDDKIDLLLQPMGYAKIDDISKLILEKLEESKGYLMVTDKSNPDTIQRMFGISKKSFKKAIGALYKQKLITIEEKGISIVKTK